MGIMDTFFHAHYFNNVYTRFARIHIIKIMCMKKSVIIPHKCTIFFSNF